MTFSFEWIPVQLTWDDRRIARMVADVLMKRNKGNPNEQRMIEDFDFYGCSGQVAFEKWLIREDATYETHPLGERPFSEPWDFRVNGRRIDVKTEKMRGAPKESYNVFLSEYQSNLLPGKMNDLDHLVFLALNESEWRVSILGRIPPREFLAKATPRQKGDVVGALTIKFPCRTIPIKELRPAEQLLK